MEEACQVLKTLFSNQRSNFEGRHYQLVDAPLPAVYRPNATLRQDVTVRTDVLSLRLDHLFPSAALEAAAELSLPAQQLLPEDGRPPQREQRAAFRFCGSWGAPPNSTNESWMVHELDRPVVTRRLLPDVVNATLNRTVVEVTAVLNTTSNRTMNASEEVMEFYLGNRTL